MGPGLLRCHLPPRWLSRSGCGQFEGRAEEGSHSPGAVCGHLGACDPLESSGETVLLVIGLLMWLWVLVPLLRGSGRTVQPHLLSASLLHPPGPEPQGTDVEGWKVDWWAASCRQARVAGCEVPAVCCAPHQAWEGAVGGGRGCCCPGGRLLVSFSCPGPPVWFYGIEVWGTQGRALPDWAGARAAP